MSHTIYDSMQSLLIQSLQSANGPKLSPLSRPPIHQVQRTFLALSAILLKKQPLVSMWHTLLIACDTAHSSNVAHPLSRGQCGSISMLLCFHFISKYSLPPPRSLPFDLYLFFGDIYIHLILKDFVFLFIFPTQPDSIHSVTESDLSVWFYYQALTREFKLKKKKS